MKSLKEKKVQRRKTDESVGALLSLDDSRGSFKKKLGEEADF